MGRDYLTETSEKFFMYNVRIFQSVYRWPTGCTTEKLEFNSCQEQETFLHRPQTSSGAHTLSHSMRTGGSFLGAEIAGREFGHSRPYIANVKNAWIYNSTPLYAGMVWSSIKKRNEVCFISVVLYKQVKLYQCLIK